MSNNITIELCAEDRARLDRLAEAMERRTCDACVRQVMDVMKDLQPKQANAEQEETTAEAEGSVEAPKTAVEEAKDSTPTTTPRAEEKPTEEAVATAPTAPTVDRDELKAKVIKLCANGLKEQVRDIVRAYAQTVTAVPDDKIAECYAKLVALEG